MLVISQILRRIYKIRGKINFNAKNNIWAALIVSTGGTLTLMFNLDSNLKILFFIIGILFSLGFLYVYRLKTKYLNYLVEKIGECNNVRK